MGDSYVCSGAIMKCTMGTSPAKLTVLPTRTIDLAGQPQANISDHETMVNLAPFGLCRSLAFPPTASATAAALGTLTPMPCMHNTPAPWMGGKLDTLLQGQPALLRTCKCQCMWGGTISIIDDGQHGEGTMWVPKKDKNNFKHNQEYSEKADNAYQESSSKVVNSNAQQSTAPVKIKSTTAELILPNFTKYHPAVQERIINMANEMPDSLNIQERLKLSEHIFCIEKAIGKRKGKRMSIDEADKQSANPNYKPGTQFSINCATTAAAYVLRLQGFDVKAKGNSPHNPTNEWLSKGNSFKIWKNTDGTEAKPTLVNDWMKQKSTKEHPVTKMTPELYKQYIEENTKEEGVYIMTLKWKNGGGHATVIQRWKDKEGILHLSQIEPQVYNDEIGAKRSVNNLCKYLTPNPPEGKGIMRVDNKLFDTQYSSLFDI